MNRECLGIFAKNWEPGKVKTRLAKSIGNEKAAEIYKAFVTATIARCSDDSRSQVVAYTPNDEATRTVFTNPAFMGWRVEPQSDGNLGERMNSYFSRQLTLETTSVVLIGTDSPNLPLNRIQQAFELLQSNDVVLGPTEDGGYYLVGVSRQTPAIFDNIPWSTPEVWNSTIKRLNGQKIPFATLDSWYDVDEFTDLQRLLGDLKETSKSDPILNILLTQLEKVLAQ